MDTVRGSLESCLPREGLGCRFLIPAWGLYSWLMEPCISSWRRAWPGMPPITIVGDEPDDLPPDIEFLNTFPRGSNWHPALYSEALCSTLGCIEEPVVFLIPVDTFPIGNIPEIAMLNLVAFTAREGVLRVQPHQHLHSLGLINSWRAVRDWYNIPIVSCANLNCCSLVAGMSMDAAFWDRQEFMSLLKPNKSFWEIETEGTHIMWRERPDLSSYGVIPPLFFATDIVQNRRPGWLIHLDELDEQTVEEVLTAAPGNWKIN